MSKRTTLVVCSLVIFCVSIVVGCKKPVEESSVTPPPASTTTAE